MAGQALDRIPQEVSPVPSGPAHDRTLIEVDKRPVQDVAAQLYGRGLKRRQIAIILIDLLAPAQREGKRDRTKEERQAMARKKLIRWEKTDSFRDLVYNYAIVQTDMEIPSILKGMSKKARNRVDAARLVLEVTNRHNPKGETQAPNITVQIANIPRPE